MFLLKLLFCRCQWCVWYKFSKVKFIIPRDLAAFLLHSNCCIHLFAEWSYINIYRYLYIPKAALCCVLRFFFLSWCSIYFFLLLCTVACYILFPFLARCVIVIRCLFYSFIFFSFSFWSHFSCHSLGDSMTICMRTTRIVNFFFFVLLLLLPSSSSSSLPIAHPLRSKHSSQILQHTHTHTICIYTQTST